MNYNLIKIYLIYLFIYRYESKGAQLAKKKENTPKTIPGAVFAEDQKEKTKKKEKTNETTSSLTKKMSEIQISSKITPEQIEADLKQKQVRKLKKQLREIEQLEEKQRNEKLEKEQLEKISKKESIIEQLNELGETDLS